MMEIRHTDEFINWLKKLHDSHAKFHIYRRIERLAAGNPGDNRFLGEISEMRINYGPGYRVYYKDTGKKIIILLCGGDKSKQQLDIEKAKLLACKYEKEEL